MKVATFLPLLLQVSREQSDQLRPHLGVGGGLGPPVTATHRPSVSIVDVNRHAHLHSVRPSAAARASSRASHASTFSNVVMSMPSLPAHIDPCALPVKPPMTLAGWPTPDDPIP